MKQIQRIIILFSGIICTLFIAQFQQQKTFAQTGDTNTWFPPENLSKTGGVTNPTLIVDPNGDFHAIWQDEFAGFVYSFGDGQTWSEPQAIDFPFSYLETSYYKFAVDSRERMHVLWIAENGELFYSRAALEDFSNISGWSSVQRMARSTIYFDIVTDENSNFHLAYLRGESERDGVPAGIYYQRFLDGYTNWSDPIAIEQTPYLRTISSEEANINIATTLNNDLITVYITWDNPPRRQIYLAQSEDTGSTWNSPKPIGNPTNAFYTPKKVQIEAFGTQAMILWKQTEESESFESQQTCTTHYLWTTDSGRTWQEPEILFDENYSCPEATHLFGTDDGFLLFAIISEQEYLLFWDGTEWSPPQQQDDFYNLTDPETNLFLKLHSLQATLDRGTLHVIGSDSFNTSDIWSTGIKIEETRSWFPLPSAWAKPEEIVQAYYEIGSTKLIADSTGRIHAFWNQATTDDANPDTEIHYSLWDGTNWSPAGMIIRSSSNRVYLHSVSISSDDVIYLVWDSGNYDGLTISWANANTAYNPLDWVISDPLPAPQWYATSPDICINHQNIINILYVLSLNEDRGVYLIRSIDGGNSWEQVYQIIDAASEGWAMVDNPHISSCNNNIEVIWTTFSLPPDNIPLALYGTNLIDSGTTWSETEEIVNGNVIWSDIFESADNTIHRIWAENERGVNFLWHQTSSDQAYNWNSQENILTTNESIDAITAFLDPSKHLHLIFAIVDSSNNTNIHHWTWDENQWIVNDSLSLGKYIAIIPQTLSATITNEGILGVTYANVRTDIQSETGNYILEFSRREIEIPETNLMIHTPTATIDSLEIPSTPTATQLLQESPTASPTFPVESNRATPTNSWSGLIFGGAIGVLFLTLIIIFGLLIRFRKNR